MHLVFWQPIPSFHQEGFLNELAKQTWVDSVELKVEQTLTDEFSNAGWRIPELDGVECMQIRAKESPIDSVNHIHIFTGFQTHPLIWQSFDRLPKESKCRVFAYAEAPPEYGLAGLLRYLKYHWKARRLVVALDGILAVGQRGVDFYRRVSCSVDQVHRFAYYDKPLRNFPKLIEKAQNDRVEFLYVGRLIRLKGLGRLFRALSKLNRPRTNWRLTVLGDGPCLVELQSLAEQLGLRQNIQWQPSVPAEQVGAYYSNSDYLLQPSRADGWGMTIVEALRYGCEPIASTACGAVDAVRHECRLPTDRVKQWPEVLLRALESGALSCVQRKTNTRRAEAYSAEAGVKQLKSILFSD